MNVTKRPRIVGHRGAPRRAPENTLASIQAAADLGCDGVEVDLRLAGDGTVVVVHDAGLARTAGVEALVRDLGAAELARFGVPGLADLLALCSDLGLWVNLELKETEPGIAHAVAAAMHRHGGVVSSFLPDALGLMAAAGPEVPRALLTFPGIPAAEAIAAAAGQAAWNPFHLGITAADVGAAKAAGLSVHVWTVDEPNDIRRVAEAGVDSIITNVPEVALAVLGA